MLKFWEVVKNISENKYEDGQVFQNPDAGDMILIEGVLCWISQNLDTVTIIAGDDLDWEEL